MLLHPIGVSCGITFLLFCLVHRSDTDHYFNSLLTLICHKWIINHLNFKGTFFCDCSFKFLNSFWSACFSSTTFLISNCSISMCLLCCVCLRWESAIFCLKSSSSFYKISCWQINFSFCLSFPFAIYSWRYKSTTRCAASYTADGVTCFYVIGCTNGRFSGGLGWADIGRLVSTFLLTDDRPESNILTANF